MGAQYKAELYQLYKLTGRPMEKHFRDYTEAELTQLLIDANVDIGKSLKPEKDPEPSMPTGEAADALDAMSVYLMGIYGSEALAAKAPHQPPEAVPIGVATLPAPEAVPIGVATTPPAPPVPVSRTADPNEMPGQRLNTKSPDEVIRVDENGRQWLQEEVRKPAYPKPRGRRVLKYLDTGVEQKTAQNGEYVETFEVAGNRAGVPAEVKITLPSYQVGIYKDPRLPFKVHCYNGNEGFDLADVEAFYGGSELVPEKVKRVYIENDLCYDIRSVVRAIADEHRHLQLTGKIK